MKGKTCAVLMSKFEDAIVNWNDEGGGMSFALIPIIAPLEYVKS